MAMTRLSDPTPRMTLSRALLSEGLRLARSPLTAVHLVCGLAAGLACGEYFSVARWDPALGADAYVQFLGALMPLMSAIVCGLAVDEEDAVAAYGLGADDYVRKPFGAAELRAKVAAHLRRERRPRSHALSFGEVRIDLGARGLAVGDKAVPLTPTEYAICEYLARHPGQVMSRAQIREAVLGWESDADDAAISMQVSRARRKLSEAGADPIATVWGMGYKWQL